MLLHESHAVVRKGPPRPTDAVAPIPAAAKVYDLTSEDDIGDALTALAASGEAISMYAPGSRDAVLGRILSVDPELPHFVMELNEGAILPSGNVIFVAVLRMAKLQFKLSKPEWSPVAGKPQLIPMVFPETCAVLNRRSCERVETPVGANFNASFVMNNTTSYELPIYDLSLAGLGLRCSKSEAKGLLKGRKLRDVELDLGEVTVVVAEMEVRVTRSFRSFLLGEQLHIGCMFTKLEPEEEDQLKSLLARIDASPQQR